MSDRSRPLSDAEARVWRAVARALILVPRALDIDLQRDSDLTMSEYQVLMILSESPGRQRRMSDLAMFVGLSASRMSRLIDSQQESGLVEKTRDAADGRGMIAHLTDAGFARLDEAYPAHLASVRERVMEPLAGLDPDALGAALEGLTGPTPPNIC
ncbi:MarR family winged helix-turn-helix transcriptional regulator [Williamsia maris]